MIITLPLRTVSTANKREHWSKRAKRAKQERMVAKLKTPAGLQTPLTVKLTRFGPRTLDDDNLAISFKAIRDGIADKCNCDDGNAGLSFQYAQEKSKDYAIRIEFFAKARG